MQVSSDYVYTQYKRVNKLETRQDVILCSIIDFQRAKTKQKSNILAIYTHVSICTRF